MARTTAVYQMQNPVLYGAPVAYPQTVYPAPTNGPYSPLAGGPQVGSGYLSVSDGSILRYF